MLTRAATTEERTVEVTVDHTQVMVFHHTLSALCFFLTIPPQQFTVPFNVNKVVQQLPTPVSAHSFSHYPSMTADSP